MSRNEQDLLLRIRGDSKEAVKAVSDTRAALSQLKSSAATDLKGLQGASTQSLGAVTNSLSQITANIPLVGRAFGTLSTSLSTVAESSAAAGVGIAGIAGPAALAAVAVVGLNAAAIKLHTSLFGLAQDAAEFRGKLFDLSQQTGVQVETLNALDIALSKVGGNIDSAAQALITFQDKLGEAQDASSKSGQLFTELGISITDTETALRDAFKALAAMPEGFEQTNRAAELFGRRGGKQFLAALKETNGDIDSAVEKLGNLARVTEGEARAADEFNDSLRDLNILIRGAFGQEIIPAATEAIKALTKTLKDNEEAIRAVGSVLGSLSSLLGNVFIFQVDLLAGSVTTLNRALQNQASLWQTIALAVGAISRDIPKIPILDPTGGAGAFNFQPGNVGGGRDAQSALAVHQPRGEIDRALRAGRAVRSAADPSVAFMAQLAEEVKKLTDSLNGLDTSTRRYRVEQEIANGALKNAGPLTQQLARAQADQLDGSERLAANVKIITDFQKAQNEQVRFLLQGEKNAIQVANEFIASLEKQGVVLSDSIRSFIEFNARILVSVGSVRELVKAFDEFQLPEFGKLEGFGSEGKNFLDPLLFENDPLPKFREITQGILTGVETMRDAFGELGGAVASTLHNFILFGSAGTSFRKFTAEIIAGVAAQAAVKAIFELAEGFAMLFLNPPAAAAHFKAAALYGAVAGAAAVAGRAVAGNAFQSQGAGAGGGGGTSSGPLQTIIQPRNQRQSIEIRVVDGELGPRIVAHVVKDYSEGGSTREVILNDGV